MATPAEQIAIWADRLRDISAMGLSFASNVYDRHHFRAVQDIAMAMLALVTDTSLETMEPLRAPIFSRPTPLATGDAAVIDPADNRILLIRRADTGQWAMPGGAFEVGETPAQGAVREVREETGIECEAASLVGVFDSRLCGTVSRHHLYHFVFLCHPLNRESPGLPETPGEILDMAWFDEGSVPEDLYPGHTTRIAEALRVWRTAGAVYIDR